MNEMKKPTKRKRSGLAIALYIAAAVLAVIFVYMAVASGIYIKNYLASYGMSFGEMWMDSVQYVVTGSISYLVYGILVFSAGKIISLLNERCCVEPVEVQPVQEMETVNAAEAPEMPTDSETLKAQDDMAEPSSQARSEIPESEDAIEKTEVIEEGIPDEEAEAGQSAEESDSTEKVKTGQETSTDVNEALAADTKGEPSVTNTKDAEPSAQTKKSGSGSASGAKHPSKQSSKKKKKKK